MVDDVPQCWKDLEAKTGYISYLYYVKAYKDSDHQSLWILLLDLEQDLDQSTKRPSEHRSYSQTCLLLELFKGSDLAVELRRRQVGICGTEVLETLQDPSREVCAQVFIWQISQPEFISPRLVDAFGLELEISPQFFKALYLLVKGQPADEYLRGHETELRPLRSDFVVIGNAVIFVSRNRPSERDSVPVVLIAGNLTPGDRRNTVLDCVDQELWDAPPLQPPTVEILPRVEDNDGGTPAHRYVWVNNGAARWTSMIWFDARADSWIVSYSELLNEFLRRDNVREMTGDAFSFIVLLVLMQLDVLWIRQSCRLLRPILANAGLKADDVITRIYEYRQSLRRLVEDSEDSLDHLRTYVTRQKNNEWLQKPVYKVMEQQVAQCCLQARRLEFEARDSLQLEAGLLALQESRKSIELSNHQIQEGRRGKVTKNKISAH